MQILKTSILAATIFFFVSCSKDNDREPVPSTPTDDCAVSGAAVSGQTIPGQYIVTYKNAEGRSAGTGLRKKRVLEDNLIPTSAIMAEFEGSSSGFVASLNSDQLVRLKKDPLIEMVEQDRVIALNTCFKVVAPTLVTWNVNKVGYGNGIGKTAWVVDTGIDFDHPDLTVDAQRSRSFVTDVPSADDENGHGTHVAGIIGAKNNSFGVLGVASGATLVSIRVLNAEGKGTLSSIVQALAYISVNAKAGDVVNMSLGEEIASPTLDLHVQNTASKGILFALAAGNDGKEANLFSPGRTNGENIFTVSAVDSLDNFASFSNYGNDVVDYAAPGVRILSTYKDGQYARMSGTSMAAPHVAGLLLLNGRNLHFSTTAKNDPDGIPDRIVSK